MPKGHCLDLGTAYGQRLHKEKNMEPTTCFNCEEEFKVESVYETEATICFCPFCGADLELDDEDELEDLDDVDEDNWN